MGEVFFAGLILINQEAQEGTALLRVVVADGSAQHGIAGLLLLGKTASSAASLRDRALDCERHFAAGVRQGSEVEGEDDADHY
jgi:hypothetical protein